MENGTENSFNSSNNLWPPSNLKRLRLRLGLSQCDLARRLITTAEQVRDWESGNTKVTKEFAVELQILLNQAELCSHEVYSQPLAERELQKKDLNQIESSTI